MNSLAIITATLLLRTMHRRFHYLLRTGKKMLGRTIPLMALTLRVPGIVGLCPFFCDTLTGRERGENHACRSGCDVDFDDVQSVYWTEVVFLSRRARLTPCLLDIRLVCQYVTQVESGVWIRIFRFGDILAPRADFHLSQLFFFPLITLSVVADSLGTQHFCQLHGTT